MLLNDFSLNINKCQTITFSKKRINLVSNYNLNDIIINETNLIKDLGILFYTKLSCSPHIISIKNKALSMFDLIMRNCSSFNDPFTLKCLYTSIIRLYLEYATSIWDSNGIGISSLSELVQNKFFSF
jgi:hypothetical protein